MVPTLLVFENGSCTPVYPEELPNQRNIIKAFQIAIKRLAKLIAKSKFATAMRRNVTNVTENDTKNEENVFVNRDKLSQ